MLIRRPSDDETRSRLIKYIFAWLLLPGTIQSIRSDDVTDAIAALALHVWSFAT